MINILLKIIEGPAMLSILSQNFIISRFTDPSTVIFRKVNKKPKIIFIFYPPTLNMLNIICFVENKNIFESDTVKRNCLVQILRKILKYLKI